MSAGTPGSGPARGRALVAAYAFLAIAACARSAVQIATRFEAAPTAFLLSAASGAVYVLAATALAREGGRWRSAGVACCSLELAGVLGVGAWSVLAPADFPEPTVWSQFGAGYGFVPLVLPVLGLLWLRRRAPTVVGDVGLTRNWLRS
jgi:hypothetical protein